MNFKSTLGVFCSALLSTSVNAALIEINFDDTIGFVFSGMSNTPGVTVPSGSQLSDELQSTTGAIFSSEGGTSYVAVVDLGFAAHAPSAPNGIGGASLAGSLNYNVPIQVSFFDPGSPTTKAVTDFVSIIGDLIPAAGSMILKAYDVNGVFINDDAKLDTGGTVLSISAAGIHYITVESSSGTVAFDNLSFNEVTAVPVPAAVWLFGAGLIGLTGVARRK